MPSSSWDTVLIGSDTAGESVLAIAVPFLAAGPENEINISRALVLSEMSLFGFDVPGGGTWAQGAQWKNGVPI